MCGFVGFLHGDWSPGMGAMETLASDMASCITHRGPDRISRWVDGEARIALGHARLAVVDLTPAGNQPMHSPSGRFVISYNGEIYNHIDLRRQLGEVGGRFAWDGHSDTETLLAGIEMWGLKETLKRSIGMFAFALWDRQEKALFLGRDRLGEKPLYYGWQDRGARRTFLFGSELKAMTDHPAFEGEIDRNALALYVRHGYVPGPHSIYRGIAKLQPGCILRLEQGEAAPAIQRFWSATAVAEAGIANPLRLSPNQAVDELEKLLINAVGQQMMADVPIGAFLSGGVDSSTIVALMQAQSSRPVKSFSIGFNEEEYNEAKYAKAVAEHLHTDHTEMYVTPREAMDVIPRLPAIYDEPFADSSQIPTFLVSQLARCHVTVSLSGDAGDELFGGYNRYKLTEGMWRRISRVPRPLRQAARRGLTALSPGTWNRIAEVADPFLPKRAKMALPGDKIHKGAGVLASRSVAELYHGLVSLWQEPDKLVIGGLEPATLLTGHRPRLDGLSDVERMMALDMVTYLPDDILAKVDRAAMSVSLETRVPLLDHRVVELAWRLPMEYKLREGETKWALRQVLYRHVPRALIERPKMGFGIPIGDWLRGPLRDWAEALLEPSRLAQEGYFHPEPVRRMWQAHLGGQVNEQYRLWIVLMFQAWLESRGGVLAQPAPARAVA
jgi:asparagine synthase (glutamine-hydrolysing)